MEERRVGNFSLGPSNERITNEDVKTRFQIAILDFSLPLRLSCVLFFVYYDGNLIANCGVERCKRREREKYSIYDAMRNEKKKKKKVKFESRINF